MNTGAEHAPSAAVGSAREGAVRPTLSAETVTTEEGFSALQAGWDALAARQPSPHPFLRHAWFRSWWTAFGAGSRLAIRVARRGGEVVGIAPLAERRVSCFGLPVRGLVSLTNDHSNRFGVLIAPGSLTEQRAIAEALWDEVLAQPTWNVVLLQHCPVGSLPVDLVVEAATRRGYRAEFWEGLRSPYLFLSPDQPPITQVLTSHRRADIRRRRALLERACGPLRLERVREPGQVLRAVSDVFDIEAAGWKGAQATAMASTPATRRFYADVACEAAAQGTLSIDFLTAGSRRLAFGYHLVEGTTWSLLKTGYAPDYARFAPGIVFLAELFQRLQAEGPIEYDFLGADDAYKVEWTRSVRRHRWWYLFPPRITSHALQKLKFEWVPWLRRVIGRAPQSSGVAA